MKGTRPPTVPQLALEQALREAGKKRAFCHNCRTQSSKEELARLEGSHCNETEFILLSLPVLSKEGAPITCAVGQGTPDFDIPLSFANCKHSFCSKIRICFSWMVSESDGPTRVWQPALLHLCSALPAFPSLLFRRTRLCSPSSTPSGPRGHAVVVQKRPA